MTDENAESRPMTDGGRTKETMADIDHTPPYEAPDASRVFERGGERLTHESD